MTSQALSDLIAEFRLFGDEKIEITPAQVYVAGSFAQKEICNDLRILEDLGTLTLEADREEYQFTSKSITNATNASPIVVTAASHGLKTGDTVFIRKVLGNTAANGKHVITRIDANSFSLNGSTGNGAYTSGGTVSHCLIASSGIIGRIRKTEDPWGFLTKKDYNDLVSIRRTFTASVEAAKVIYFYEIATEPITIGVLGTPEADLKTAFKFYRIPLPDEDLSSTVDPIIPAKYDKLLYWTTLFHTLDFIDSPKAEATKKTAELRMLREKAIIRQNIVRQRVSETMDESGIDFKM